MAQRAAACVCATAGGVAKHIMLRSRDLKCLASSRSAGAFAGGMPFELRGSRLHSLINALSNDFISASLSMLAIGGARIEIGKNQIWSLERCSAARVLIDYVAVAVDEGCRRCPGWNRDAWWFNCQLKELAAASAAGTVSPLPIMGFPFQTEALQDAMRLLQRGTNLGKVVLRISDTPRSGNGAVFAADIDMAGKLRSARSVEAGSLARLSIDHEDRVVTLELNDPLRFNTMR